MNRPPLEVADIVRCAGQSFIERSRKWINGQHEKVLLAITRAEPPHWVDIAISARTADILPSRTTRVATGIAPSVRATPACAGSRRGNESCCPPAMCTSSSRCRGNSLHSPAEQTADLQPSAFTPALSTLLEIARDPRHLGAEIGFFSVLHTWDQRLQHHPHVHCVLAAGGLAPDHSRWISSHRSFFLPVKVLSHVFRGKFIAGLKTAFHAGALQFHGTSCLFENRAPSPRGCDCCSVTTGSSTPNRLSAGQNMCSAISALTLIALPFPTAGWLLSPRAT